MENNNHSKPNFWLNGLLVILCIVAQNFVLDWAYWWNTSPIIGLVFFAIVVALAILVYLKLNP